MLPYSGSMVLRMVLFIWLGGLFASTAFAAPPVDLRSCDASCLLGNHLDILVDHEGGLTIEDVLTPHVSSQFDPSSSELPKLPRVYGNYWVRFTIHNSLDVHLEKWLVLDPFMVTASLFIVSPDGAKKLYQTGAELPLFKREIINVRPIIPVDVPPNTHHTYYMKVRTPLGLLKLELWSKKAFIQRESLHQYVIGIWLGCMVVSFFFNLFVYLSIKDTSYLYYILFLSGLTLSQLGFSGHTHYIFPPWLSFNSLFIFSAFYAFWGIQFSKTFLHIPSYLPRVNTWLNVLMAAMVLPVALIFFGMELEGSMLMNGLGIVAILAGLSITIYALAKGYKPARFFLLAWAIMLEGMMITLLSAFRILPWNFFTEYGIRIGSALGVVLLSYALVERIQLMKAQKEDALKRQLTESRKLADLSSTLKKYVPREFIKCLNKSSIVDVRLGDYQQREMTILFSDIRSFTSLSGTMTPEENFRFINSYLKRMEPSIRRHRGFIDKYIGDAIMALFDHEADDAVHAAIDMLKTLPLYNQHRSQSGYAPIRIGIGINTGMLMLGTVGGENRMEGTVISDAVNFASRMEDMTKIYGASLLISEFTYRKLKDPSTYMLRMVDRVLTKGKDEPISVFEVLDGEPVEIRDKKMRTKTQFEEAVGLYSDQAFDRVHQLMSNIVKVFPEDKAARVYVKRCSQHLKPL